MSVTISPPRRRELCPVIRDTGKPDAQCQAGVSGCGNTPVETHPSCHVDGPVHWLVCAFHTRAGLFAPLREVLALAPEHGSAP